MEQLPPLPPEGPATSRVGITLMVIGALGGLYYWLFYNVGVVSGGSVIVNSGLTNNREIGVTLFAAILISGAALIGPLRKNR